MSLAITQKNEVFPNGKLCKERALVLLNKLAGGNHLFFEICIIKSNNIVGAQRDKIVANFVQLNYLMRQRNERRRDFNEVLET